MNIDNSNIPIKIYYLTYENQYNKSRQRLAELEKKKLNIQDI